MGFPLWTARPPNAALHPRGFGPAAPSSMAGEIMTKVKAISSFEHHGRRDRGAEFEVTPQHADLLAKRGLVKPMSGAATDSGSKKDSAGAGASLVDQNAAATLAAIAKVSDVAMLADALSAEQAKGEKARKSVIEAISSAIAAAQPQA